MRTFYGSTFIDEEKLRLEGKKNPIKLEYYKIINEDEFIKKERAKYGVKIVKTEYMDKKIKIEEKEFQYISNNEDYVNKLLNLLKRNIVTPISMEDIIKDLFPSAIFM